MSFANRAGLMRHVYRAGAVISISSFTMMLATAPALGALSESDLGAISTAVSNAIASSSSGGGQPALTQALTALTASSVNQYGAANASSVASNIMQDAIADGASPQSVGQAMGAAALAIGAPASNDIADAVGEGGGTDTLAAFDASVSGAPGGAELEAEADGAAGKRKHTAFGSVNIGGGVTGAGGALGLGLGLGIALCVNPSCT